MKKNYTSILAVILGFILVSSGNLWGQCTPDPIYTQPGIYPDSATGLDTACAGQPYSMTLTAVIWADTCVTDPATCCFDFTDVTIMDVIGLPPGMTWDSNRPGHVLPGGQSSCVIMSGIAPAPGIYPIEVAILANLCCGTPFFPCGFVDACTQTNCNDTIRDYFLVVEPAAGAAGTITGPVAVCAGQTGVSFSVNPIPGVSSYNWNIPAGATIVAGANTEMITVNFAGGFVGGVFDVSGNNDCGAGAPSPGHNVASIPLPGAGGAITGPTTVCEGDMGVSYSAAAINDATGYNWVLPTGAVLATGANTNAITVDFPPGTVSGNITVVGTNACGTGAVSPALGVTVNTAPATPTITPDGPLTFCDGDSVVLTSSPGATYTWSSGETTQSITVHIGNSFTVTITNAGGCGSASSPTITTLQGVIPTLAISAVPDYCATDNGSATVVATPAGPWNYIWSDLQTTATASALGAGTYGVTVSDGFGCADSATVAVSEPPQLVVSITGSVDVTCGGGNDGQASASAVGGTPGYTWNWNTAPPQMTATATAMIAGNFDVIVNDVNGCADTAFVTISEPPVLVANIVSSQDVSCNGNADGQALGSGTGGTPGYSFSWNTVPPQAGANATGLGAGSYDLQITDANGCVDNVNVTVNEPTPVIAAISGSNDPNCSGGNDGQASASGSGGTPGYNYSWNTVPVQTTAAAVNLGAGSYTVSITDANGCSDTEVINLTAPPSMTLAPSSTNSTCGNSDGSASVSASGGTPGYTYLWNTVPVQTTSTASNLSAGTYRAYVTDANGCVDSIFVSITDIGSPILMIDSTHDVSCNGGNDGDAYASATSGTPPYAFVWGTVPPQPGQVASALSAGSYSVTITDNNGCIVSQSVNITEPAAVQPLIDSVHAVDCNGNNSGEVFSSTIGGTPGYSYAWNTVPAQFTSTATGLSPGTYDVIVTDINGCTGTENAVVSEPTILNISLASSQDVSCGGGTNGDASVTANGGTPGYSFVWNTVPPQTGSVASGLAAGNYDCVVTDANGCFNTLNVVISEPPTVIASISGFQDISCNGANDGSATVSGAGGNPGYTFAWNTVPAQTTASVSSLSAGTYTVTVTDNNGCVGITTTTITQPAVLSGGTAMVQNVSCFGGNDGQATASPIGGTPPYTYLWNTVPAQSVITATGLTPGNYTVTVTDANGCVSSSITTVAEPAVIGALFTVTDLQCFGASNGAIDLTVSGGVGPFTYSWTGGSTLQDISGLAGGNYQITITDANGCVETSSADVIEPTVLIIDLAPSHITCNGLADGSVVSTVSGGTPSYLYSWSTGGGGTDINSLGPGSYDLSITDANSCIMVQSVTVIEPPVINLSVADTNVLCFGDTNGAAGLTIAGGISPYTQLWNTGSTSGNITNLSPGTYSVTVTDSNNCVDSISALIVSPAKIVTAIFITNPPCEGIETGQLDLIVSGGVGAYNYNWASGEITEDVTGLGPGEYIVAVSDSNGCEVSDTAILINQDTMYLTLLPLDVKCAGDSTGAIDVTLTGGTPPYVFSWSNGDTSNFDLPNAPAGAYTLDITDGNGCPISGSTIIEGPANPLDMSVSGTDETCENCEDGTATATAIGGNGSYTYAWSDGQTGTLAVGFVPGTYYVTATDADSCQSIDSVVIGQYVGLGQSIDPELELLVLPNPNNGKFILEVSGNWIEGFDIVDLTGRVIFERKVGRSQAYREEIELKDSATGVYFIRVQSIRGRSTLKFVLE